MPDEATDRGFDLMRIIVNLGGLALVVGDHRARPGDNHRRPKLTVIG